MKTERERVIVITGASSGIGAELAVAWGRRGSAVVLSGRNELALARVARRVTAAGGQALVEPGDITTVSHAERLVEGALREHGRLDVLINNAGQGYYGSLANADLSELGDLFALNVWAPLRLTQKALPALAQTRGTIVMMSSVAGVVAMPGYGGYAASKFALEALSMSLRAEVRAQGIRVLVVRPGPVDTPFRENAFSKDPELPPRLRGGSVQSPEEVAEKTVEATLAGQAVLETSPFVKWASRGARWAPAATRALAARVHRPPKRS